MRAAVFKGAGVLELEDVPEPVVEADDDVIIEVEACGICGSDLQILNVPPGHPADPGVVMGHEFIGRVQATGASANGLAVGQRVTVDPDPKCGVCRPCRAGRPASCEDIRALGIFRDGALAPLVKAPAAAVFRISEDPPARVAALIEPLACVVNGVNKANPRPGESAIIFGAGAIGCLFLAMFKAAGVAPVIVVEPQAARAAVATAVDHAALGGRIVLFGMNETAWPAIHQYRITHRSLSVLGTYVTAFTFPTAIRLVEGGELPLDPIVTHVLPLDRVSEGLDLLRSGGATKVVITPGPPPAA
jgi:threonine dehydrogenase-like Zn-dependent dehydrogenase